MDLQIMAVDKEFEGEHLADFLPPKMIDVHTHVWLKAFYQEPEVTPRGPTWPSRVADEGPVEDLLQTYQLMFPRRSVTPVIFGAATRSYSLDQNNGYVSQVASQHHLPSLIVTTPNWSAPDLERRVIAGGFLGLKPYLEFAPAHIPSGEITIFDFLPHQHLEVADAHGWIVILHIPRHARLKDHLNLQHLLEIERRYLNVRLVIAHIGRAYCSEDVGPAFDVLKDTQRMLFDFSANTNAWVMEQLLRAVGSRRVVFGSDLPITRMRMRRICERGFYVNLVPPGLYGDISDDPHMRELGAEEGQKLSFFMYEELLAFRQAAQAMGLSDDQVADVFYNNAAHLITGAGGKLG
jgi:predicted TIM-barrel fold metal-dependent hydrolase